MSHKPRGARLLAVLLFVFAPVLGHADPPARTTTGKAKPRIVLVHGAWADGSSWDKVVPILEKAGYNVVAVHLPLTSTEEDVAAVTRAIEREPGDVVLAGHSYGGIVISKAGNNPKVKSLVFVDAFGLDNGETVSSLINANPPAWVKTLEVDGGGYAWMPPETVAKDFAQDLPPAEQKLVAAKQGPIPVKDLEDAMKDPAWKSKPSWYLRGTADRIIDPAAQEQMAKRMKATLVSVNSSHVAMLAKPRDVAKIIEAAATKPPATASK